MSKNKTPKRVVGIVASFMGLAGVIIFLLATKIVGARICYLPVSETGEPSDGLGARSDRKKYASYSTCSIRYQKADDIRQCMRGHPSIEPRL